MNTIVQIRKDLSKKYGENQFLMSEKEVFK